MDRGVLSCTLSYDLAFCQSHSCRRLAGIEVVLGVLGTPLLRKAIIGPSLGG